MYMFKCQATGRLVPAGESAHRLVTHVRSKTYTRWNHKKNDHEAIGHGSEIVREILVCKEYFAEATANSFQPEVVRSKE
jgi:hypothetical protein